MMNPFRNVSPGASLLSAISPLTLEKPTPKSKSRSQSARALFPGLTSLGNIFRQADNATQKSTKHSANHSASPTIEIVAEIAGAPDSSASQSQLQSQLMIEPTLDAAACLEQGRHLAQQDLTAALHYYRQAISLDASFGEAYQHLAEALTELGELEEAAGYYRLAIALAQSPESSSESSSAANLESASLEFANVEAAGAKSALVTANSRHRKTHLQTTVAPAAIPWFEQAMFHLQQGVVSCNTGKWQEAVSACETALKQLEPQAFTVYLTLGRSLQQQQQFAEAEQAYRKALTLRPESAEAYARLASLYGDQQRYTEATQLYQLAIQHDPQFAGAYWKLAAVWQQIGETERAVACWHQAYELQSSLGNAASYCELANQLLQLGQTELAQTYCHRALQQDPNWVEADLGLGRALSQQGKPDAAIAAYRSAVKKNPSQPQIYVELSAAFVQLEQWPDALVCYQRLAQLAPDQPQLVAGFRQCYVELEQWSDALIYSQKQVELTPNSAQDWHQLADVFSRLERWSDAAQAYRTAIALDANFSWSHNNLGDALLRLEDWSQAAAAFRAAIALHPSFAWSHYNLGTALAQLQEWNGAIDAYQTALSLQPDLPHVLGQLAYALQQRAQADRTNAIAFYQKAIQQNPQDPENYHKALELTPEDISLYLGLVDALLVQERLDEALICCQIARQLQPDSREIIPKFRQVVQRRELSRKPRIDLAADYNIWMQQHTPTPEHLRQMAEAVSRFDYQPLISILMPVYNTPESFLTAAIQSVLAQVYPHWQLCIADDASTDSQIRTLLSEYAEQDPRITLVCRPQNGHIAAASNSALAQANGDYIALLDHDDLLAPEALYEVVDLLNRHPEADMVYSDEDKLDRQGQRIEPFFKPDWCPDSFLARMYTCHLGIYRRSIVEAIGGFRTGFEGSQDYDLVLRLSEQTDRIFHIPKVLYHWRAHTDSTSSCHSLKPYAETAAQLALSEACQRRGEAIQAVVTDPKYPGIYAIRYQITAYKPVSIIIPTRNLGATLDRCLTSIFTKTTYPDYEVVLIDNGSDQPETLDVIAKWHQQEARFKSYGLDIPFNYSTLNNYAVTQARGDYLLFLNNDTEIISPDWVEAMVEQAQRPSIGAVGGLLLYPDQTVQHAGVVLGLGGIAGHSHKHFPPDHPGYCRQIVSINNYSALTAACLMCRREVFEQVNGFDESLAVAFNDVDFCLKIKQLGYHNVYLPHVKLYHHESKSRGLENTPEKQYRFQQELKAIQQRWHLLSQLDPCYNPNLTLDREDYSLRI